MPKVTVVMAAHNAANFLEEAVSSVLEQDLESFELVIIDDGSTDNTARILAGYGDARIRVIKNNSRQGQTQSLNRALKDGIAGKYVARVDADDIAEPSMLAEMVSYLDRHPEVGMVGSAKIFIDSRGAVDRLWDPPFDHADIQKTLLEWNCLPHCGAMYRRDCLAEIGLYSDELRFAQDYDLALRISERWDAANLDKYLYRYRWHDGMVSVSMKQEQNHYIQKAINTAFRRRLAYGWAYLGIGKERSPAWLRHKPRRWVAQRYTWWSAASRGPGRAHLALQFLLIALLSSPRYRPAWKYLLGVLQRKSGRVVREIRSLVPVAGPGHRW